MLNLTFSLNIGGLFFFFIFIPFLVVQFLANFDIVFSNLHTTERHKKMFSCNFFGVMHHFDLTRWCRELSNAYSYTHYLHSTWKLLLTPGSLDIFSKLEWVWLMALMLQGNFRLSLNFKACKNWRCVAW